MLHTVYLLLKDQNSATEVKEYNSALYHSRQYNTEVPQTKSNIAVRAFRKRLAPLTNTMRHRIRFRDFYLNENNLVMFNDAICVPEQMVQQIMEYFHSTNYFAHQGIQRTTCLIKQRFYWRGMYHDIKEFVDKCPTCIKVKGNKKKKIAKLILFPARYPFHMIAIDTIVIPETKIGYRNCVTIIDRFSRYAVVLHTLNIK